MNTKIFDISPLIILMFFHFVTCLLSNVILLNIIFTLFLKKYYDTYQVLFKKQVYFFSTFFRNIYLKKYYYYYCCKFFLLVKCKQRYRIYFQKEEKIIFKIFAFYIFCTKLTFAICHIHQHHSLLFYPRSFYSFFSTLSIFLRFAPVSWQIWNYSYESRVILFKGVQTDPSKNQRTKFIFRLVIHLSFEPDFDWNKVNTPLSIREHACLHSMCILLNRVY